MRFKWLGICKKHLALFLAHSSHYISPYSCLFIVLYGIESLCFLSVPWGHIINWSVDQRSTVLQLSLIIFIIFTVYIVLMGPLFHSVSIHAKHSMLFWIWKDSISQKKEVVMPKVIGRLKIIRGKESNLIIGRPEEILEGRFQKLY